jgi:hypothetical protein
MADSGWPPDGLCAMDSIFDNYPMYPLPPLPVGPPFVGGPEFNETTPVMCDDLEPLGALRQPDPELADEGNWVLVRLKSDPSVEGWIFVSGDWGDYSHVVDWTGVPVVIPEVPATEGLPDFEFGEPTTVQAGDPCVIPESHANLPPLTRAPDWEVPLLNAGSGAGPTSLTVEMDGRIETLLFNRNILPDEKLIIDVKSGGTATIDPSGIVAEASEENNKIQLPVNPPLACGPQ